MGKLDGKITIITGATSGIGRCTAEVFVAEGAQVLITGRRRKEGNEIAEALGLSIAIIKKPSVANP